MDRFAGLRFRLLLLALIAIIPILGMTLYAAAEDRQRERSRIQASVLQMAQSISNEEQQLVRGTRELLVVLARIPSVYSADPEVCGAFLTELIDHYQRYANLGVIKLDGSLVCSAVPPRVPVNASEEMYFRRALSTREFSVGDYQIDGVTDKAVVHFAYPVLDEVGGPQAVVFAALDLQWFNQLELDATAQLPRGATLFTVDSRGMVLTRAPDPEEWVGRSILEVPLVQMVLDREQGIVEAVGPEGMPGVYAFAPVASALYGGDIYVISGFSKGVAFGDSNRALIRNLAGLGLATVLALVTARAWGNAFIQRQVDTLLDTAERLSEGDLSARTGAPPGRGELARLAQVFDKMAEALELREAERREAEEALRHYAERLQALSRRLMETQETERRHIARELHDEIGQALTAIKINVQAAQRLSDAPLLVPYLQESISTVERTLQQVRDLSLDLRPSLLDDLGLVPALRWLVTRQSRQTGLVVQLVGDQLERRLPSELEIACFRIVQEALTNVVRHAQAQHVCVELCQGEGEVSLAIRDDGVGFDVGSALERAKHGESIGLLGMRERALIAGGQVQIESEPGRGTEIRVRFVVR